MTQTLYNCRTIPSGFTFVKFDGQLNIGAIYNVSTADGKLACDCPGWPRRSACKHTRMVSTFALAGAIDTSQFYCYKTQTWHQPIQGPWDQDDPSARKAANLPVKGMPNMTELMAPPSYLGVPVREVETLPPAPPPPKSSIRRV